MRSRSCGLHSQSQEEFLELAQASIDNTGIFYDQKINRKVMANVANTNYVSPQSSIFSTPQSRKLGKNNSQYIGFDYSPEIEASIQEKQQLERIDQLSMETNNIGILTDHPQEVLKGLSQHLKIPFLFRRQFGEVDLVIQKKDRKVTKYWVFRKERINDCNRLLRTYLNHCSELISIDESYSSFTQIEEWVKESIPYLF